jgi:hypothetical protein
MTERYTPSEVKGEIKEIDGDHSLEQAIADLHELQPLAKPNTRAGRAVIFGALLIGAITETVAVPEAHAQSVRFHDSSGLDRDGSASSIPTSARSRIENLQEKIEGFEEMLKETNARISRCNRELRKNDFDNVTDYLQTKGEKKKLERWKAYYNNRINTLNDRIDEIARGYRADESERIQNTQERAVRVHQEKGVVAAERVIKKVSVNLYDRANNEADAWLRAARVGEYERVLQVWDIDGQPLQVRLKPGLRADGFYGAQDDFMIVFEDIDGTYESLHILDGCFDGYQHNSTEKGKALD